MEKEFEVLEDLSKQEIIVKKGIGVYMDGSVQTMPHKTTVGVEFKGHIETLKQALTELQAIKEAKPSEALKWLEKYKPTILFNTTVVENALLKAQEQEEDIIHYKGTVANYRRDIVLLKDIKNEQEKVLEIIKDLLGKFCKIELVNGGTYYQIKIKIMGSNYSFGMSVTQEEFELLKRWAEVLK